MGRYGDTGVKPSANMKEHQARVDKCYDFTNMKIGERKTFITPAFNFIGGEDSKYGQHSSELIFVKREKRKAVHVMFYTGWYVNTPFSRDGFMCTGLGVHYKYKKDCPYPDIASYHDDCPYTGGKCYFELGSSLYGDTILDRLINEGSAGVWDEIDQELNSDER